MGLGAGFAFFLAGAGGDGAFGLRLRVGELDPGRARGLRRREGFRRNGRVELPVRELDLVAQPQRIVEETARAIRGSLSSAPIQICTKTPSFS